tara:strand:- start:17 stop:931 length:915 start_codon:yes stop_codon:yes gene_type:complete
MKEIPSGSVDAIICDPPYGTVRNAGLDGWENKKTDWDVCLDHGKMLEECNRILRTSGALVLFCQDPYTAKLMTETHGNLPFSYRMTWLKDHFANSLIAKKAPVNYTEDICVFFKRHTKNDFEGTHPLRPYFADVLEFIGKNLKQINTELGHRRAEHCFYINSTQFGLCTEATYCEIIERYSINKMQGFRQHKDLEEVNAAYRADLIKRMTEATPRRFNLHDGKKYKSNILEYKKDYNGYHPTQKPVALLEDLIKTYSNEGETVLDFTCGSGSTGVAAVNTGRDFIGIEMDEGYFKIAENRIKEA